MKPNGITTSYNDRETVERVLAELRNSNCYMEHPQGEDGIEEITVLFRALLARAEAAERERDEARAVAEDRANENESLRIALGNEAYGRGGGAHP